MFAAGSGGFPRFNVALEGWCTAVQTLSNKIAERRSRFQPHCFQADGIH